MEEVLACERRRSKRRNFDVSVGLMRKAGELGLLSVDVPEEYGGLEMDKVTSALVAERSRSRAASR